jgi:hypothetical protein
MRHGRFLVGLALMAATTAAFANGFGGSDAPPARIPVPAREHRAIVEDQSGVRVEVTQVSLDGEVFVFGRIGEGQATVPFDKIKDVRFEPTSTPEFRVALITLRDGGSVRLQVKHDVPAYGRTAFGTYSIAIDKIRRIEFPS